MIKEDIEKKMKECGGSTQEEDKKIQGEDRDKERGGVACLRDREDPGGVQGQDTERSKG